MADERWTKSGATPGEDPRDIDDERSSPSALDQLAAQEGIAHPAGSAGGLGTSSDAAPGSDLSDLRDAPEVTELRDEA